MEQQAEHALHLEVGKTYRDQMGRPVQIVMQLRGRVNFPFMDSDGYVWSETGKRPAVDQAHIVSAA